MPRSEVVGLERRIIHGLMVVSLVAMVGCTARSAPTTTSEATTSSSAEATPTTLDATPTTSPATTTTEDRSPELTGSIAWVTDTTEIRKIWSVSPDTGDVRPFSEVPVYGAADLQTSPDGKWVATLDERTRLVVLDVAGEVVFRSPGEVSGWIRWSAGGEWLNYRSDDELVVLDPSTGEEWRPLDDAGFGHWAPVGSLLWVPRFGNGAVILDAALRTSVTVDIDSRPEVFSWSPGGDSILVAQPEFQGETAISMIGADGSVQEIDRVLGQVTQIAISNSGLAAYTIVVDGDGYTRLFDIDSRDLVADLDSTGDMGWSEEGLAIVGPEETLMVALDGQVSLGSSHVPLDQHGETVFSGSRFAHYARPGIVYGEAGRAPIQRTDVVVDGSYAPVFLADGQGLVFVASLDGNRNEELYLLDENGVTRLTDYPGHDTEPALFGEEVLFISDRGGGRQIRVRDLGSGIERAFDDTELPAEAVALSPDLQRLAVLGVDGWSLAVFEAELGTGETVEVLGVPESVIEVTDDERPGPEAFAGAASVPIWSPGGEDLAIPSNVGAVVVSQGEGLALGADVGLLTTAYEDLMVENGFGDLEPHNLFPQCHHSTSWSPDGTALAFVYPCLAPWPIGLWVVDAIGGEPRLLSGPIMQAAGVAWSPDGGHIAFSSADIETQAQELSLVPLDGGQPETVAPGGVLPVWSPDGSRLAFVVHTGEGMTLMVRESNGDLTRVVTVDGQSGLQPPRWSPDGEYLAYLSSGEEPGVYVIEASEGAFPVPLVEGRVAGFDWR